MNDLPLFAEEDDEDIELEPSEDLTWKVIIIDDEQDIHEVTKLVLRDFELDGGRLEFLSAYSAAEAMGILKEHNDIAVAFVDVVMETSHAGLDLVKYIRNELQNKLIRLILRTGQPGQAPEESVIRDYDINDYKNKVELTEIKLKTLMYTAIRSYRDLKSIEQNKLGLERIIASTVHLLQCDTLKQFGSTVLEEVARVLGMENDQMYCCMAVHNLDHQVELEVLAKTLMSDDGNNEFHLPDDIYQRLKLALQQQSSITADDFFVGYFTNHKGIENLLYVDNAHHLEHAQHDLLAFFSNNIAVSYDNIRLREVIKESQKELSYILGEAVEKRSKETGGHVKRVANFSALLAKLYGLNDTYCETIKLASPLHDVGKIGIPDAILNKPAKLDDDEWLIMQTHAQIGYEVLNQSQNDIIQMGAIIAQQHHEKFNGKGYPQGLAGEDIHIAGRITALADVFDALASERCYKPAWPMDDVLKLLREERGQHFDPRLVDLLLDNLTSFIAIRDTYPD